MRYQVIVPESVEKELSRLDNPYRQKIATALLILANDPYQGKKLKGEYEGKWSYRVWPYRIIYEILRSKFIVLIVKIGHRQGIY